MAKKKIRRTSIWYSHAITEVRCPSCKKWATALILVVHPKDYTFTCQFCKQDFGLINRSANNG